MELDKAALDRWITREPDWFDDADAYAEIDLDNESFDEYYADEIEGSDPDLAYDRTREERLFGI